VTPRGELCGEREAHLGCSERAPPSFRAFSSMAKSAASSSACAACTYSTSARRRASASFAWRSRSPESLGARNPYARIGVATGRKETLAPGAHTDQWAHTRGMTARGTGTRRALPGSPFNQPSLLWRATP
jgi:hypothetical protein